MKRFVFRGLLYSCERCDKPILIRTIEPEADLRKLGWERNRDGWRCSECYRAKIKFYANS